MKNEKLLNIQIVPSADNPLFEQRESGITHTSYLEETAFFSFVQQGNTEMVKQMLGKMISSGIVIGHLSKDCVRQMQYWAVCCVTLGTRYAIQGGLNEMKAFNLSDGYIMKIDKFSTVEEIVDYLKKIVVELTEFVRENAHGDCPIQIRRCLNYIDKHLNETIRLSDLAALTNLSGDYLSKCFKKYVGQTVRDYILHKKLEAAKAMLHGECNQKLIAYELGFCSQTYFITCFRKAYGITPHKYASMCRNFN